MYLILNAHSSNELYNGDCDYAIVELTPALAKQIRSRATMAREAWQQDDNLYDLHFWGSTAEFYGHGLLDACQDAAAGDWLAEFEQQEYAIVPASVDLTIHEAKRTECDQVVVCIASYSGRLEVSVAWSAIPKHSDVEITTVELQVAAMEELLSAKTHNPPPNPCVACGRTDLPLHTSGRCGACGPNPASNEQTPSITEIQTYEIEQYELHSAKYRINATSEAEAIAKFYDKGGEPEDGSLVFIEVANDYGLPTGEFPELVKALEQLGVRVDDDIIESIRDIEVV